MNAGTLVLNSLHLNDRHALETIYRALRDLPYDSTLQALPCGATGVVDGNAELRVLIESLCEDVSGALMDDSYCIGLLKILVPYLLIELERHEIEENKQLSLALE